MFTSNAGWLPFVFAVAACVTAFVAVGLLRIAATRRGVLDRPNERSLHATATPRGGGAAIVLVTVLGVPALLATLGVAPDATVWLLMFAACGIAVIGAFDDVRPQTARLRLAVHLAAACVVLIALVLTKPSVFAQAPLWLIALATIASLVWMVGFTNAYNFMDGVDGLAAAQTVVAGLGWVLLAVMAQTPELCAFGLLLGASSAGFAVHNWPPARIFMGDVGSTFIGFILAMVTVWAGTIQPILWICGVVLVWPFLFDTAFTMVRRIAHRENLFRPHRSHLYQRLVSTGWTHLRVTVLYIVLALSGVTFATFLFSQGPGKLPYVLGAVGALSVGLWALVDAAESGTSRASGPLSR